ncbi:MAG TPA: hypothetical protein VNN07_04335 [Candidatus Tectomicrobia bacterium]|nr:hypothetical protein [Candidatus Tectomicrobia bacterium]
MSEETSLEGWAPEIPDADTLERVIDLAFDYRGDVTLDLDDGRQVVGYLFNRDARRGIVQVYERDGAAPVSLPYAAIRAVRFTGRDMAAGQSYEAWLGRGRPSRAPASE